jgi:hypothetical protein
MNRVREVRMAEEDVREGFEVFTHDGEKAFGAVRKLGRHSLVIYVENAGEFVVPLSAVRDVHSQKVILDRGKLEHRLREAIDHAHDAEDPNI